MPSTVAPGRNRRVTEKRSMQRYCGCRQAMRATNQVTSRDHITYAVVSVGSPVLARTRNVFMVAVGLQKVDAVSTESVGIALWRHDRW